jgi:hypothetical protein
MTYYEIATAAHGRIDLRTGELAQLARARFRWSRRSANRLPVLQQQVLRRNKPKRPE